MHEIKLVISYFTAFKPAISKKSLICVNAAKAVDQKLLKVTKIISVHMVFLIC